MIKMSLGNNKCNIHIDVFRVPAVTISLNHQLDCFFSYCKTTKFNCLHIENSIWTMEFTRCINYSNTLCIKSHRKVIIILNLMSPTL